MKKCIFLAIAAFVAVSCGDSNSNSNSKVSSKIDVEKIKNPNGTELTKLTLNKFESDTTVDMPLSDLIESLEVIQLDGSVKEAFVGSGGIYISDNYIGITGSSRVPFKLFDRKSGKYIATIGNIGRGHGEYFAISSAQIDEPTNRLYLLPWMGKSVLVYDLKGEHVSSIPLPEGFTVPKGHLEVDSKNKLITIGILPFEGLSKVVWQQDFEGNLIQGIDVGKYAVTGDYSNEVYHGGHGSQFDIMFVTWSGKPDSLYHYNKAKNNLDPIFTIDFGEVEGVNDEKINKNAPLHSYYELPNCYMADISYPVETSDNDFITSKPVWLYVDKAESTASWFVLRNDFFGNYEIYPYFIGGYFVNNLSPISAIEKLTEAEKTADEKSKKRISELLKSINEEGNNVIMYGKLKQ